MTIAITGAILAVVGFLTVLFQRMNLVKKENQIYKAKEVAHEAKKIVADKSDDQLVDDFNKRYSESGNGD